MDSQSQVTVALALSLLGGLSTSLGTLSLSHQSYKSSVLQLHLLQLEGTLKRNKQSCFFSPPIQPLLLLLLIGSEGWGGLYSGLKPSILGTAASQDLKDMKKRLKEIEKDTSALQEMEHLK
ncbi:hypothetical protein HN51_049789 [Arachis hypogaea]|uniref:uncharacterized protein n=1 Tax=Arachis hypogaea TaxID=3818 RepID=UPI000DED3C37|nr:uncharacterized protein LOC112766279 [Arachis hypogaea]XP_025667970.1 uncharacterized protein LOC112766279 [Arachis hypogaea]XP_025667971.1 uncharacterized protein LOC112766279 [Arachis hypogaea]XP_029150534.1 uncharacterized protein LOC112766279 [Arachis hypogaea]QHN91415.1 Peroxisomal membrane proteinA [Arachis hypogaea]